MNLYRLLTDVEKSRTYVMHAATGMYFKYCYAKPQDAKQVQQNLALSTTDRDMNINHVSRQEDTMYVADAFGDSNG